MGWLIVPKPSDIEKGIWVGRKLKKLKEFYNGADFAEDTIQEASLDRQDENIKQAKKMREKANNLADR